MDANAQQNSDLFWALKGGGPNFGQSSILLAMTRSAILTYHRHCYSFRPLQHSSQDCLVPGSGVHD